MRRGRMGSVANQEDAALVPRIGQQQPFQWAVIGLRMLTKPGANCWNDAAERLHQV